MSSSEQNNYELIRLRILVIALAAILSILLVIMWRVQVVNSTKYTKKLNHQSIRRVRLPGIRGSIYDRNGICMADNKPSYCIAIYIEELRQPGRWVNTVNKVEDVIHHISKNFNIKEEVTRKDISRHIQRRLPLPFLAWKNVSPEVVARIKESTIPMPGVDIYIEPVRVYPQKQLAAHVIGYVGTTKPKPDKDKPFNYYLPEMEGKSGVEKTFNSVLAGTAGGKLIRIDASGFKHNDKFEKDPKPGTDIYLTIDLPIQQLAENALHGIRGACVVVNPRNGDVLALASSPAFDISRFSPSIPYSYWKELNSDKRLPLFNRAISGAYAPGSIFKPVVAITLLEDKIIKPYTEYNCPGYFQLGNSRFHCWKKTGHGMLDVRKALEQSCNAFFCHAGYDCGYQRIYHMAYALGLGRKTGIALPGEVSGVLPNDAWKRKHYHEGWRGGDTCNFSIGQGFITVTPIQMALYTAAIANGGTLYHPRIVIGRGGNPAKTRRFIPGRVANQLHWNVMTLETVRGGMFDVVNAPTGTGKRVKVPGMTVAGKTGTAEYGPRYRRKKNTWMIVFAPYTNPRYAIAMIVEDGISGGITVAPRLRHLLMGILKIEHERGIG